MIYKKPHLTDKNMPFDYCLRLEQTSLRRVKATAVLCRRQQFGDMKLLCDCF